jgi:hypothetical protein
MSATGFLSQFEEEKRFFLADGQGFDDFLPFGLVDFIQLIHFHKLQGMGGAGFHANRIFHESAAIAFESHFSFRPGKDDPVRAVQGAGPAGDATVFPDHDHLRGWVPSQGTGQAGIQAGGLQTLTALQGEMGCIRPLHAKARLGQRVFLDGFQQRLPAASPFGGTGKLAGLAPGTPVEMNSDYFHDPSTPYCEISRPQGRLCPRRSAKFVCPPGQAGPGKRSDPYAAGFSLR